MSKGLTIAVMLLLAVSSIVIFRSAYGVASKPSVPNFTVKYVDCSYYEPIYGTDQYTGEKIIIEEGGRNVDNRTIQFTIKNQLFNVNNNVSADFSGLFYNFKFKVQNADWRVYPFSPTYSKDGPTNTYATGLFGLYSGGPSPHIFPSSTSDYTIVSINIITIERESSSNSIRVGSELDVQVQALVGQANYWSTGMLAGGYYYFTGEASDWSSTQKVTIGESKSENTSTPNQTTSPTPSQTPAASVSPTQVPTTTPDLSHDIGAEGLFGFSLAQVLIVLLSVAVVILLAVAALLWLRRRVSAQ